jgi:ornithine cyclodeaminase
MKMKPKIFRLTEIKEVLNNLDPINAIEKGFVAYSRGQVIVPPVGEMIFENPPGDVHIKYGYIIGDDYYVIKIASGFYENVSLGLSSGNGLMLIFMQKTGELAAVLLDEGYLTDIRTAAGAVAARFLAPKQVSRIGVFGAGVQGKLQVSFLKSVIGCREVIVWGINKEELLDYQKKMEPQGFHVETTLNSSDITATCNLIITATPSKIPIVTAGQIQKGTHITAMGSDTSEKNELDPKILQNADIVVADSISQCLSRGEIFQAIQAGLISKEKPVELGNIIAGESPGRTSLDQITVSDLTGVAIQDIQITKAVYEALCT